MQIKHSAVEAENIVLWHCLANATNKQVVGKKQGLGSELVRSSSRLTPRGLCVTVDDFAYSSMVAAIFCLAFTITLWQAFTTTWQNVLWHLYCIASTLSFARYFHYYTLMTVSAVVNPLSHMIGLKSSPPSVCQTLAQTCLTILSKLSTSLLYICHFLPGAWKKLSALFAADNHLHCSGCWLLFHERGRGTPTSILPFCQTSRFHSRRWPPWSPTGLIPLDAEEMGVRAICHLITNSILLTSQTSTNFVGGVPGPQAIRKELLLHLPWALAFLPLYVSLYITQNSSLSLAYCICTHAVLHSHTERLASQHPPWRLGQLGLLLLTSALLGNIERRGQVTTATSVVVCSS